MLKSDSTSFGISVITVVLNERDKLMKTIESVLRFSNLNPDLSIEHLVIDGASSDGTLELLKSKTNPSLRYISEKDNGIYQAMNTGVAMGGSGGYVLFINAGDTMNMGEMSSELKEKLMLGLDQEMLAGFAFSAIYKIGIHTRKIASRQVDPLAPVMPGLHQGMVYKRRCLLDMPFDESFKICGDYEQFARMFSKDFVFIPIDEVLSTLYAGGVSTDNPLKLYRESTRITKMYFRLPPWQILITKVRLTVALLYVRVILIYSKILINIDPSKNQINQTIIFLLLFFVSMYDLIL
jgi:putative colanic acid biosynthesis glycosyltransferase